jgi:nitrogen regulatory protein P-II 1
MKKLTMVVHSSLQQELADCLRRLQLDNFMFTHVEEHSAQLEKDAFLSPRDKVVGFVPQVRVDVILDDDRARSVLEEIRHTRCAFKGRGLYWITDVEESGVL